MQSSEQLQRSITCAMYHEKIKYNPTHDDYEVVNSLMEMTCNQDQE